MVLILIIHLRPHKGPSNVEIIQALNGKDPPDFHETHSQASFSHNTLREHLNNLVEQGLVERNKKP
jgi:DNA-binding HxlR family transcriptional regulator